MIVFVKEKSSGVIRRIKWFLNGEARTSDQRLVSEDGSGLGNLAIQYTTIRHVPQGNEAVGQKISPGMMTL
jgi:hypothetical protein